jgi:hypothetical protein
MTELINIKGYIPIVPNEVYNQDIEITSPDTYVYENGAMKPAVIGHYTKVITFAKFNGLSKAALENLINEAETATCLYTMANGRKSSLYIETESAIQDFLLKLPYERLTQVLGKARTALDYMNAKENDDSAKQAQESPDTLIVKFGVLPHNNLDIDDTSNPFFSIGDQIRDEAMFGKKFKRSHVTISLNLKKGKLPDKERTYTALLANLPEIYAHELKNAFEALYHPSAIDLVHIRAITPDVLEEIVMQHINRL